MFVDGEEVSIAAVLPANRQAFLFLGDSLKRVRAELKHYVELESEQLDPHN